jgi:hypothetical protein
VLIRCNRHLKTWAPRASWEQISKNPVIFIKKGTQEEPRGTRPLPASDDPHDLANRLVGFIGMYTMLRRLAQLLKVAENDHFCCGVVPDTESASKNNIVLFFLIDKTLNKRCPFFPILCWGGLEAIGSSGTRCIDDVWVTRHHSVPKHPKFWKTIKNPWS